MSHRIRDDEEMQNFSSHFLPLSWESNNGIANGVRKWIIWLLILAFITISKCDTGKYMLPVSSMIITKYHIL